jgi:hypothetical protein
MATFEHLAGVTSLAFVFFLFTGFVTEVPLITLPFSFTALLGSVVVLFTPALVFLDSSFLEWTISV